MQETEVSGVISQVGAGGFLALAMGLGLLVLAIVVAVRRGSRRHAFALTAAAFLPYLLASSSTTLGQIRAQNEIVRLGPAVTTKDLAHGRRVVLAASLCGSVATFFALCGASAALARSRP